MRNYSEEVKAHISGPLCRRILHYGLTVTDVFISTKMVSLIKLNQLEVSNRKLLQVRP